MQKWLCVCFIVLILLASAGCSSGCLAAKPFQMEVRGDATWRDIGIWAEYEWKW